MSASPLPTSPLPASVEGVPAVAFRELTRAEAERHLDVYVQAMPQRLARLRTEVPARGGPPAAALDLSRESLDVLWTWYRSTEHALTPPWSPDDPDLPVWLPHWPCWSFHRAWSAELVRDLDLISGYVGEVILHADPTARWAVGHAAKRVNYIWQHQPVIVREGSDLNPRHQNGIAICRTLIDLQPLETDSLQLL